MKQSIFYLKVSYNPKIIKISVVDAANAVKDVDFSNKENVYLCDKMQNVHHEQFMSQVQWKSGRRKDLLKVVKESLVGIEKRPLIVLTRVPSVIQ